MILAAGLGTRLWPLTADRAKPAVPFLNKPIIASTVEYLKQHGVGDLIVNLHHQGDSIREALGDGSRFGAAISYSEETDILGTGGALDKVRHLLEDSTFVVINGKIITDIDLQAVIDTHRRRQALATLVLMENPTRARFSIVEIDGDHRITRFAGFPKPPADAEQTDMSPPPLMFTGIQVVEPAIFDYIPRGVFSHTTIEAYPRAIADGQRVIAHVAEGTWHELSTLDRYLKASLELLKRKGKNSICGAGTVIEDGAEVVNTVLWQRVYVPRSARLRECVVGDDVAVAPGGRFERAAIICASRCPNLPPDATLIGENLVVAF
jgi:NDP-sugar pyrophosphorylase family protein